MRKILITPRPFYEQGKNEITYLKSLGYEVIVNDTGNRYSKTDLLNLVGDVDAILTGNDLIDREVILKAKKLKIISKYGVGLDNIDVKFAEEKNIKVCKALNANSVSVAETTMMMILTSLRKYYQLCQNSKKHIEKRILGSEAEGKVLAIIGLGSIGKKVAKYANALGMRICGYDPFVQKESLKNYIELNTFEEVISKADIISLHLPLLETTKKIISKDVISKMRTGAIIVNTARGGLIDEDALYENLLSGHLGFVSEDIELKERSDELITLPTYNITPHSASFTKEADQKTMQIAIGNILRGLEE